VLSLRSDDRLCFLNTPTCNHLVLNKHVGAMLVTADCSFSESRVPILCSVRTTQTMNTVLSVPWVRPQFCLLQADLALC
jgi:hypothetical protein